MSDTVQFTIGAKTSCSDGTRCEITRVIVNPVTESITHLVIEPGHRRSRGRLVPLALVDASSGEVRLRCTEEEFEKLDPAEETRFLPGGSGYQGFGPGQVGYWPYYNLGVGGGMGGGDIAQTVTFDSVPPGEVDVQRGDPVEATDGDIGRVQGLVIDRDNGHVTHVLLQEGHLWGRKEVAIPISSVVSTSDGIRLRISKQEVQDLPSVDVGHPGAPAGA
jgi:sporulation protein YlmC with PRC-barrel domain